MIKPGWTHILTLRDDQRRVIFVSSIEGGVGGAPYEVGGHYLVPPPHRRSGPTSADGSYRFVVYDVNRWEPVCEGRHSNPDALLTQEEPEETVKKDDIRIGKSTGTRYKVLALHGIRVWTCSGDDHSTWKVKTFLESTVPAPTFFEEGHDYERVIDNTVTFHLTVRHVGKMPNGTPYAVAEIRSGPFTSTPTLLRQSDFNDFKDVTK